MDRLIDLLTNMMWPCHKHIKSHKYYEKLDIMRTLFFVQKHSHNNSSIYFKRATCPRPMYYKHNVVTGISTTKIKSSAQRKTHNLTTNKAA